MRSESDAGFWLVVVGDDMASMRVQQLHDSLGLRCYQVSRIQLQLEREALSLSTSRADSPAKRLPGRLRVMRSFGQQAGYLVIHEPFNRMIPAYCQVALAGIRESLAGC